MPGTRLPGRRRLCFDRRGPRAANAEGSGPRFPPAGVPRRRRGAVRDLHAGDADGSAGLSGCRRRSGRGWHPRGDRRQSLPLHWLYEDHRGDLDRGRRTLTVPVPFEPPIETPRSLAEAYAILARSTREDQVTPIAGGTDVIVGITGELGEPPTRMVDLSRLDELRGIAIDGDALVLGALTTYTSIRTSSLCRE